MAYSFTAKNGTTYYLHSRGRLFYFSKDPKDGVDLPQGYEVMDTGRLPVLKKK